MLPKFIKKFQFQSRQCSLCKVDSPISTTLGDTWSEKFDIFRFPLISCCRRGIIGEKLYNKIIGEYINYRGKSEAKRSSMISLYKSCDYYVREIINPTAPITAIVMYFQRYAYFKAKL